MLYEELIPQSLFFYRELEPTCEDGMIYILEKGGRGELCTLGEIPVLTKLSSLYHYLFYFCLLQSSH